LTRQTEAGGPGEAVLARLLRPHPPQCRPGKWAALGDEVLVAANATQAVRFGPTGKETLTEAELKALAGK
jgi:hypothetical protein